MKKPAGWYVREALHRAREHTGVETATLQLYVAFHQWSPKNKQLVIQAKVIAKSIDLMMQGKPMEGWDLLASRLRALVFYNQTGSWTVAEGLQSHRLQDAGLASTEEVYRATRAAKLMQGTHVDNGMDSDGGKGRRNNGNRGNKSKNKNKNKNAKGDTKGKNHHEEKKEGD